MLVWILERTHWHEQTVECLNEAVVLMDKIVTNKYGPTFDT